MNYTPLYIKTDNSIMQSFIKIKDLIEYASKNNIKSLAIADSNLYGAMDFYMLSLKNNIKPIIGLELIIKDSKIVLYSMNFLGYKNLLKINKIKSERDLNLNDLLIYKDFLICLIPFEHKNLYHELSKIYSKCFVTYKNKYEQENIVEDKMYMNETLCLTKEDLNYLKYLNKDKKIDENYLHLDEEIVDYNDSNNYLIYELCNLEIPLKQSFVPKYINEENLDSYSLLKKKCILGLKKKFGDKVFKKYQERLKYELDIINKMNFSDYFLIVEDYVSYAKKNNIIVGPGRGSVVASLVAYLLDITEVDPVSNDLLFERFLNVNRVTMPDIDIDFEHIKREDMIEYCIDKYGKDNVVPIITFGTMGVKQTIKEVGNILSIDNYLIDNLSKILNLELSLKENYKNKKVIDYIKINNLETFAKVALKFEGLKHHISVHAAGIIISKEDLTNIIPVVNYNGKYISGVDMTYLEEMGLLKMDFLAIRNLTLIHEIIDEINFKYNLNLKFNEIPNDDLKTLETFEKGDTLGIFQFESNGMIEFLRKLKPKTFSELCIAMALYRPGPMKNIDQYINNKNNPDKINYLTLELEDILKPTNGILIYQEQIMQMAMKLADYTQVEADVLRKAMSKKKKDDLIKEEEKFLNGCKNNNIDSKTAKKIYELMLKFAEYGFNKAHSYGYSVVSYRMAYLKTHYRNIFMAKMMNNELGDKEKIKKYIYECKKNDINILKPNINISSINFEILNNDLVYPLIGIKEINTSIANIIVKEREKKEFADIYDFIIRCNFKKPILENLIKAGCFDCFKANKKTLIENLELIINYGELINEVGKEYALKPILKEYSEYELKEILKYENNLLGLYLSNHPTTQYKNFYQNIVSISEVSNYFDKNINIIVYVSELKEIMTKKNEKMGFIVGEDEIASIDLVLFPKQYSNYKLDEGMILLVNGKVEKRFEKTQIVINKLKIVNEDN